MSFTEFINESWVTLLLTFLPLYYAFQLLKNERLEMIRPKGSKAIEKKKRKPIKFQGENPKRAVCNKLKGFEITL